jgi:hypothetical protein
MTKVWAWLLARTSMEINIFQLVVWLPCCAVGCIAIANVNIHLQLYQFMLFALVLTYVFFLPLIFDCVKDYLKSK